MTTIIGSLIIFCFCPLLGGLPLIDWLNYIFKGQKLSQMGTGNVSVSAAFYHGGTFVGILAVLSEAGKGVLHMEFTPRGERVWVSVRNKNEVHIYDTRTLEKLATLPAQSPSGIFFTDRAHKIGL